MSYTYSQLYSRAKIHFDRRVACLAARCVLGVDAVEELLKPITIHYTGYGVSKTPPLLSPSEGVCVREFTLAAKRGFTS